VFVRLGDNVDLVAVVVGVIAFFVGTATTPASSCGSGYVEDASALFAICQVLSPLAFGIAALAALGCRRHVGSKIAGLLAFAAVAVAALIALALAGAPCAFY
jgi:hypothetical protein